MLLVWHDVNAQIPTRNFDHKRVIFPCVGKGDTKDLLQFLRPFDDDIQTIALWLRDFVWDLFPECNELIYDGPNALAFGWTPSERTSDTFCTIAIYNNDCVQFGFYWGSLLDDPKGLLEGKGKQYRFIRVVTRKDLPKVYAKELLNQAYVNSLAKAKGMNSASKGTTTVRLISPKKKRPIKNT